jgi:hypothetical protein
MNTALRRVLASDEYDDIASFLQGWRDNEFGDGKGEEFAQSLASRLEDAFNLHEQLSSEPTDFYAVLGVARTASDEEVAASYRRLALQLHPDKHPAASTTEKQQFEAAMARVNVAYSILGDSKKRSAYDLNFGAFGAKYSRLHPPTAEQCMLCGNEPAREFQFQYQHAAIFRGTRYGIGGSLCNECALSLGRSAQNRTLAAGWWGITAFFTNWPLVWRNSMQLHRAYAMDMGERLDTDVVTPMPFPLPRGRSVFGRAGFWIAAVLVVIVASVAVGASRNQQPTTATNGTTVQWAIGNCVDGTIGGSVRPVDCGSPHVGRIVAAELSSQQCPVGTEGFVEYQGLYYCINPNG